MFRTLLNKNGGNLAGNASACLAKKLAYSEEMTLCYKFRPSDDLFSGLFKLLKEKPESDLLY